MPSVSLTAALRREYLDLFNTCSIRPGHARAVEAIVARLNVNVRRYREVGDALGIPWFFVGVIHNMEASLDFARHLHNGDPLTGRTFRIPAGRPRDGTPPFTWEESASDALSLKGLGARTDWSLAGTLYQLERYNGWGYRLYHPHVPSPYLWSFANHYRSGKYVADGTWSETAVSRQCGAAAVLRRMAESRQIEFPDQPAPAPDAVPLVVAYSMRKSRDPAIVARAEALQRWLNTFPGIFVRVDGVPGKRTSEAYRHVTGSYLPGDPRDRQ
jgi:lysozyme family protein